jgi:hypothetical protein
LASDGGNLKILKIISFLSTWVIILNNYRACGITIMASF